jgi:hypothetical protein
LTSAVDGDEWSASRSGRFTHGTHFIEGWVSAEPVWTLKKEEESLIIAGNRAPAFHHLSRRYAD